MLTFPLIGSQNILYGGTENSNFVECTADGMATEFRLFVVFSMSMKMIENTVSSIYPS